MFLISMSISITISISISITISLTVSVPSSPPDSYRDWRGWLGEDFNFKIGKRVLRAIRIKMTKALGICLSEVMKALLL
jgi:hypothetical protein